MSFLLHEAPGYWTSDVLEGTAHCFSTRSGGVSSGVLESLNLGIHRGDRPENVRENYRILGAAVGFRPEQTVFTRQLHGAVVARVGRQDCGAGLQYEVEPERDGLITDEPGVALTVFSADCTPILLYDPVHRAVGAVHSGWRGTALGIVRHCVEAMRQEFHTDPASLHAAIGPCVGLCCFETDGDVPEAMRRALGAKAERAIREDGNGKYHVDLKRLNALWLEQAGVRTTDICPACTACRPELYWSHRIVGNARGSLAAIIMLKEGADRCDD